MAKTDELQYSISVDDGDAFAALATAVSCRATWTWVCKHDAARCARVVLEQERADAVSEASMRAAMTQKWVAVVCANSTKCAAVCLEYTTEFPDLNFVVSFYSRFGEESTEALQLLLDSDVPDGQTSSRFKLLDLAIRTAIPDLHIAGLRTAQACFRSPKLVWDVAEMASLVQRWILNPGDTVSLRNDLSDGVKLELIQDVLACPAPSTAGTLIRDKLFTLAPWWTNTRRTHPLYATTQLKAFMRYGAFRRTINLEDAAGAYAWKVRSRFQALGLFVSDAVQDAMKAERAAPPAERTRTEALCDALCHRRVCRRRDKGDRHLELVEPFGKAVIAFL